MLKPSAQTLERSWSSLVGAALFGVFAGVVLLLLLLPRDANGPLTAGRVLSAVALAALYATPGALALLSRRHGRPLLAAAGALGLVLIPTSMSITPLLVVPSALMLVSYFRPNAGARSRVPTAVIVVASIAVAAGAFAMLFIGPGTRCWTYRVDPPTSGTASGGVVESGCSQDVIAPVRSIASLALLGVMTAGAAKLSEPRRASP